MYNRLINRAAILVGVLCVGVAGFLASSMVRDEVGKHPRIALPHGLELGEMLPGIPRTVKTSVRNVGRAPLEIYDLYSSCNSEVEVRDKTVLPGQETRLTITFTPTFGVGQQVEVDVLFRTNDPTRQPVATLALFGYTSPGVRAFPSSICVGEIVRGSVKEGQLVVTTPHQRGLLEIEEISSSVEGLTLNVSPSAGDGWTKLISNNGAFKIVDYRYAPTEIGDVAGKVHFRLSSEVAEEFTVPFEAMVVPAVRLVPKLLVLGVSDNDDDGQRLVGKLLAEAPGPIHDVRLKGDNKYLSLQWQIGEDKKVAHLVVGFAPESGHSGTVIIEVAYGNKREEVRLPWRLVRFN